MLAEADQEPSLLLSNKCASGKACRRAATFASSLECLYIGQGLQLYTISTGSNKDLQRLAEAEHEPSLRRSSICTSDKACNLTHSTQGVMGFGKAGRGQAGAFHYPLKCLRSRQGLQLNTVNTRSNLDWERLAEANQEPSLLLSSTCTPDKAFSWTQSPQGATGIWKGLRRMSRSLLSSFSNTCTSDNACNLTPSAQGTTGIGKGWQRPIMSLLCFSRMLVHRTRLAVGHSQLREP